MEKFIVSARKFRPNNFVSLIGQENIAVTLKNSIKRKYNLVHFDGRLGNELQLMDGTKFPVQNSHEDLQV